MNLDKLPEKWYICGGEELAEYFSSINNYLDGSSKELGYYLYDRDSWLCKHFKYLIDYNEIDLNTYKRLLLKQDINHKTCKEFPYEIY